MTTEKAELVALEDASLEAVAGGRGRGRFVKVDVDVDLDISNTTTVTNNDIHAGGDVNIGNQSVSISF